MRHIRKLNTPSSEVVTGVDAVAGGPAEIRLCRSHRLNAVLLSHAAELSARQFAIVKHAVASGTFMEIKLLQRHAAGKPIVAGNSANGCLGPARAAPGHCVLQVAPPTIGRHSAAARASLIWQKLNTTSPRHSVEGAAKAARRNARTAQRQLINAVVELGIGAEKLALTLSLFRLVILLSHGAPPFSGGPTA